jgi:hypothetical protein
MENGCDVIVFDADRRVRFASSGAGARLGVAELREGASLDDAFSADEALREWAAVAADNARESGASGSCVRPGDAPVHFCVAPIASGGFAVVATDAELPAVDGDRVSQRAWHDIKNQLGGLKLFATFLKIKLGNQDEQIRETTEKIVGSIDAIVRAIADVRRGEDTKGEKA